MFAIIGLLLGFIVGFIFSSTMSQRAAQSPTAVTGNSALPADHPQIQGTGNQDPQQVFADVQAAITKARSEPNNFDAQMKAAELYYKIQRFDQAIEYLLKANQLNPGSFEATVALGQVNLDAAHFDQAEKWFKALTAPVKHFFWFENTAHMVQMERPGLFAMHMINDVRPLVSRHGDGRL